jgi:hypothetical protein
MLALALVEVAHLVEETAVLVDKLGEVFFHSATSVAGRRRILTRACAFDVASQKVIGK